MQQVASQNAPSPFIVVPHFIIGAGIWLIISILIILSPDAFLAHYFNPKLLAITHLIVLGFITMIIFGALYQLTPVIMELKLYSEKLAIISLLMLVSGTLLLGFSFWNFLLGSIMYISAALIVAAVILFAINIFITGNRSSKNSIQKDFILTSIIWLMFTVIAGTALAVNLTFPFLQAPHLELLKLHSHAGIAGWFIQLIIGVGSRLLPMFMVSHNLNEKKLKIAYYFINGGLITGIVALFLLWEIGVVIATISVVAGILCFISYIFEAYKKRIKKHLDIGMKQTFVSFLTFIIALILVLLLISETGWLKNITERISMAYGVTLLIGFITSLIMGQTYKTLPFIIWLKVYRNKVGRGKIPLPKELYSEKAATFQLWFFASGFFILLTGIIVSNAYLIRLGGIFLFLAILLYNYNLYKIVLHKAIVNEK